MNLWRFQDLDRHRYSRPTYIAFPQHHAVSVILALKLYVYRQNTIE